VGDLESVAVECCMWVCKKNCVFIEDRGAVCTEIASYLPEIENPKTEKPKTEKPKIEKPKIGKPKIEKPK